MPRGNKNVDKGLRREKSPGEGLQRAKKRLWIPSSLQPDIAEKDFKLKIKDE